MISRMVRVALLDVDLYEEIEHNERLTVEALRVVSFIPVLGGIVQVLVMRWTAGAGFVAMRQALDINNESAAGTVAVALVPALIGIIILSTPLAWLSR